MTAPSWSNWDIAEAVALVAAFFGFWAQLFGLIPTNKSSNSLASYIVVAFGCFIALSVNDHLPEGQTRQALLILAVIAIGLIFVASVIHRGQQAAAFEAAAVASPASRPEGPGETIRRVTFDPNDWDWKEGDDPHEDEDEEDNDEEDDGDFDEEEQKRRRARRRGERSLRALVTETHAFRDAPPAPLLIRYHTEHGKSHERIVRPRVLVTTITDGGLRAYPRLRGHCEQSRDERTFRLDRIEQASNAETGQVIQNLHAYLSGRSLT